MRVNLTLPEPVALVIADFAELTGQTMAGAVTGLLINDLPYLKGWLRTYRNEKTFDKSVSVGERISANTKARQQDELDRQAAVFRQQQRAAEKRLAAAGGVSKPVPSADTFQLEQTSPAPVKAAPKGKNREQRRVAAKDARGEAKLDKKRGL